MFEAHAIITLLMTPVWLPPIRLMIYLFGSQRRWPRASVWFYGLAFVWAAAGVSYQLAIRIPSGIGYAIVLVAGWLILLFGIALDHYSWIEPDPLSSTSKERDKNDQC